MNQDVAEGAVKMVEFTVRNDKYQGVLVEKFSTDNNEYFFKAHQQPLSRHCEQIQQIVRSTGVQRTKKIRVDIGPYKYEYYNANIATFKGCPLESVNRQIDKVCNRYINKELGAMKRAVTVAQTKQQKIDEKNKKTSDKMKQAEKHFQMMRAKRIADFMGLTADGSEPSGQSSSTSSPMGSTNDGSGPSRQSGSTSSAVGSTNDGSAPNTPSTPAQSPRIVPMARISPNDRLQATGSGSGAQTYDDDVPMDVALPEDNDSDFE